MDTFLDYFDYKKDDATEFLKKNIILNHMNTNIMSLFLQDFIKVTFFLKNSKLIKEYCI